MDEGGAGIDIIQLMTYFMCEFCWLLFYGSGCRDDVCWLLFYKKILIFYSPFSIHGSINYESDCTTIGCPCSGGNR